MTHLDINLKKTTGLSVNLSPVVLRCLHGRVPDVAMVKVKVNVDLYSASS